MRLIGIRHRVKESAEGKARPTEIAIMYPELKPTKLVLNTEQDELDWIMGKYPSQMRQIKVNEDVSSIPLRHIVCGKVPESYQGLETGDIILMILGGSGDKLAAALARLASKMKIQVKRVPSYLINKHREGDDGSNDHFELIKLYQESPELFYDFQPRDADLIVVKESLRDRTDAVKARIACEQRISAQLIGRIFTAPDGLFPEGAIEEMYLDKKANSELLKYLLIEEKARNNDLMKAVTKLDVWHKLFADIPGVGPRIAAGIIAPIGDIRRFATAAKLKAFAGVAVNPDGSFVRRRRDQTNNWNPALRQSLYLLADQFNRRPDSIWGQAFREYKVKLRESHPEVIMKNKKKRYTDGHIHKMAVWRTLTKFVEWLWSEWTKLEYAAR